MDDKGEYPHSYSLSCIPYSCFRWKCLDIRYAYVVCKEDRLPGPLHVIRVVRVLKGKCPLLGVPRWYEELIIAEMEYEDYLNCDLWEVQWEKGEFTVDDRAGAGEGL